jgi:hypothetical protein
MSEEISEWRRSRVDRRQRRITNRANAHLLASERLQCAPATALVYPWAGVVISNPILGGLLEALSFPLAAVVFDGFGVPVGVAVTDSRILVTRRWRTGVTPLPTAEVESVQAGWTSRRAFAANGVSNPVEVVEIRLAWEHRQRVRFVFLKPWRADGDKIAREIVRQVHSHGGRVKVM